MGAKIRGELTRPGTSRIGMKLSTLGSGFGNFGENTIAFSSEVVPVRVKKTRQNQKQGEPQITARRRAVKYAAIACESAVSGFDAGSCGDYVTHS